MTCKQKAHIQHDEAVHFFKHELTTMFGMWVDGRGMPIGLEIVIIIKNHTNHGAVYSQVVSS